jgi:hypothetical protein
MSRKTLMTPPLDEGYNHYGSIPRVYLKFTAMGSKFCSEIPKGKSV